MTVAEQVLREEDQRERGQRIHDRILLLTLFARVAQQGYIGDPMKVQKTVFLVEYNAAPENMLIFHYPYFRWKYGPFSKELKDDYRLLSDSAGLGYLRELDQFDLQPKAVALAEAFWLDVVTDQRNEGIRKVLEATVASCAGKRGWDLQKKVYELKVCSALCRHTRPEERTLRTVRDTPESYEFFLVPPAPRQTLVIPQDWKETLSIELAEHSEARKSLERAEADIAAGRVEDGIFPADVED